jgi:hypothetical protein
VLTHHGFQHRQPSGGSSHYVYRRGHFIITIAKHKPYIHSKAVKEALNAIDQVRAEEA